MCQGENTGVNALHQTLGEKSGFDLPTAGCLDSASHWASSNT